MITRSNLAEQLREYQLRSKSDWASVSIVSSPSFSSSSSSSSGFGSYWVDVVILVIWELVICAFLVFSAVSLYFQHMRIAFILIRITMLLPLCMRVTKNVRLVGKKKRRMFLPLSM